VPGSQSDSKALFVIDRRQAITIALVIQTVPSCAPVDLPKGFVSIPACLITALRKRHWPIEFGDAAQHVAQSTPPRSWPFDRV